MYFVSKALKEAEINYPPLEKLVLSLVHASRRLQRYFQGHQVKVRTYQPIKEIMSQPDKSGRHAKWAVELGEHGIVYMPWTAIKGQVLANFMIDNLEVK
ncbi:MAG: hypothetical protein Q8755_02875 [Candidatus Phytoplasma australasiaticum]|nr:hypothetical protein [Candidatus Phytoplasma australasiaticum]